MKGHGREMIQFGIPIVDASPEDEAGAGSGISKDRKIEPIPRLLQDVIECFIAKTGLTAKPDSCIIDIFNEGDHLQPTMWPHWFGRPVSVLFLTECEMTFGKVIGVDSPGDYQGPFRLSALPGSMLVMQGRSADFAKYALPSQRKLRILVTLTKSQPRRSTAGDVQRFPSSVAHPPSHWVPPSRSPNHMRHPAGNKHYGPLPTTGVLPAPTTRPQLPPPNGMQPIFVPAPVAPAMPFPSPVALAPASTGWPAAPPRHAAPSLPIPGTGVFLPPGSATVNPPTVPAAAAGDASTVAVLSSENEAGNTKLNGHSTSAIGKDEEVLKEGCNGAMDGTTAENSGNGNHHQTDSKEAGKAEGTA